MSRPRRCGRCRCWRLCWRWPAGRAPDENGTPVTPFPPGAELEPGLRPADQAYLDMGQRFQELGFTRTAAPANRNRTPPGHYMVFLLNGLDVPSVGKIVRVR